MQSADILGKPLANKPLYLVKAAWEKSADAMLIGVFYLKYWHVRLCIHGTRSGAVMYF